MRKKKTVAILLILLLLVGSIGGVAAVVRKVNAKVIPVIPVESIAQDYYFGGSENKEMNGTVTTSATQKVVLDNEAIVEEVYVKVGDQVRVGDRLMSYDVTLTQMELELEKLTTERNQRRLKKAEERLRSLEAGGPILDEEYEDYEEEEEREPEDSEAESAKRENPSLLPMQAACLMPVGAMRVASAQGTTGTSAATPTPTQTPEGTASPSATPSVSPTGTPTQTPAPQEIKAYTILDEDAVPYRGTGKVEDPYRFLCSSQEEYVIVKGSFLNKMAGYDPEGGEKVSEEAPFWYRLEFHEDDTVANPSDPEATLEGYYTRKGGKEPMDPGEEKYFPVDDAMLLPDDTTVLTPTPTPEPSQGGEVPGGEEPGGDSPGDEPWGNDLPGGDDWGEDPPDDWGNDAPGSDEPGDDGWGRDYDDNDDDDKAAPGKGDDKDDGKDDGNDKDKDGADKNKDDQDKKPDKNGEGPDRAEAIKSAKASVNNLRLQIKTNLLQISKLQRKIENQTILASINGTVTVVGDPITGKSDSEGFIEVESEGGLFVEGAIDEMSLDQFIVGQLLTATSYESGAEIEMELREISRFPVENTVEYFDGMGNPNMSYYTFLAEVTHSDMELKEGEGVSVRMPAQTVTGDSLNLDAAFVRSENGIYYVYKEEEGKLKKQIVTASKSYDGISVSVTSGLKKKDKIAFPYGRGVEEGAPTREGTLDELYGYY